MSTHDYTSPCPVCGGEMRCFSDTKQFEDVGGDCIECGFFFFTEISQRTLEELNEYRKENDIGEPLGKLAEPLSTGMKPPTRILPHPFDTEDLITIFEAARLVLNDKGMFTAVADVMDLEESDMGEIADKLDRYMRPEQYT